MDHSAARIPFAGPTACNRKLIMSAQPITATQMAAMILARDTPCPICDLVRYFCPMGRKKMPASDCCLTKTKMHP